MYICTTYNIYNLEYQKVIELKTNLIYLIPNIKRLPEEKVYTCVSYVSIKYFAIEHLKATCLSNKMSHSNYMNCLIYCNIVMANPICFRLLNDNLFHDLVFIRGQTQMHVKLKHAIQ